MNVIFLLNVMKYISNVKQILTAKVLPHSWVGRIKMESTLATNFINVNQLIKVDSICPSLGKRGITNKTRLTRNRALLNS